MDEEAPPRRGARARDARRQKRRGRRKGNSPRLRRAPRRTRRRRAMRQFARRRRRQRKKMRVGENWKQPVNPFPLVSFRSGTRTSWRTRCSRRTALNGSSTLPRTLATTTAPISYRRMASPTTRMESTTTMTTRHLRRSRRACLCGSDARFRSRYSGTSLCSCRQTPRRGRTSCYRPPPRTTRGRFAPTRPPSSSSRWRTRSRTCGPPACIPSLRSSPC